MRFLGRGFRFRCNEQVLAALRMDLRERAYDQVIFSGDATALGFQEEMARAAELLGVDQVGSLPGLAVPGNHDYCTMASAVAGHFERYFASWQQGFRLTEDTYPFAQRIGHLWLVGVNSAVANRWPWDARGAVGESQLRRWNSFWRPWRAADLGFWLPITPSGKPAANRKFACGPCATWKTCWPWPGREASVCGCTVIATPITTTLLRIGFPFR